MKKSAFSDAAAFSDAQKAYAPRHSYIHGKSMFSDTAKKLAFGDAQKRCAPRRSHSHDKSVFSDTAKKLGFGDAQKNFVPPHKRGAYAGAYSPDKSVCSGVAAFNDPQISRTPLKAQKKQAFRGVAAFSDARKIDAPPRLHTVLGNPR